MSTRVRGNFIGYRQWLLSPDGELMPGTVGVHGGGAWSPGDNTAVCAPPANHHEAYYWHHTTEDHEVPGAGCHCGFYGWHRLDGALRAGGEVPLGAIQGWGRMAVHADGFRAEKARVVALAYEPETTCVANYRRFEQAARRYGVRLVEAHELAEAASAYGGPVPESERPAPEGPAWWMHSANANTSPTPLYVSVPPIPSIPPPPKSRWRWQKRGRH